MKTKKIVLASIFIVSAMIVIFTIGLNSQSINKNRNDMQNSGFTMVSDTLKIPEPVTETRSTQIEIVNGKKRVTETIIKMRGDSIIEKKVIEKEEDLNDDQGINFDHGNMNFQFRQLAPQDLDSIMQFGFSDFFGTDSSSHIYGFNSSPGLHFNFDSIFEGLDNDIIKNFEFNFAIPNFDMSQQKKRMEELQKHFMEELNNGSNNTDINPFENQKLPNVPRIAPYTKPKSINEIITEQLLNDGYIDDIEQKYKFDINEKGLTINGKKQDKAIYEKYKNIIEDNMGIELEDEFNFKFTNKNKKKLDKKTRRI